MAKPFVIGLTGSIGMGKSQTARLFAEQGIPVFDADAVVHALYAPGGAALLAIAAAFPGAVTAQGVDRALLSAQLGGDGEKIAALEKIVHPLTLAARGRFLAQHAAAAIVLLDIPLLLEVGVPVDAVVVATAPAHVQNERVLARPGMTAEKFEALLARQTPDAEKRRRADYLIDTGKGLEAARGQVRRLIALLTQSQA